MPGQFKSRHSFLASGGSPRYASMWHPASTKTIVSVGNCLQQTFLPSRVDPYIFPIPVHPRCEGSTFITAHYTASAHKFTQARGRVLGSGYNQHYSLLVLAFSFPSRVCDDTIIYPHWKTAKSLLAPSVNGNNGRSLLELHDTHRLCIVLYLSYTPQFTTPCALRFTYTTRLSYDRCLMVYSIVHTERTHVTRLLLNWEKYRSNFWRIDKCEPTCTSTPRLRWLSCCYVWCPLLAESCLSILWQNVS